MTSVFHAKRTRGGGKTRGISAYAASLLLLAPGAAFAQRASESAVTAASDAFGVSVGNERIGLYTEDNTRGFSPVTAGNRRIEGMYIDLQGPGITPRLITGSVVRVGLTSIGDAFPAPSGVVDYRLRPAGDEFVASLVAGRPGYGEFYAEVDAQIPILRDRLSLAAGAGYSANVYQDGRATESFSAALIPRLRFDAGTITGFWTYGEISGDAVPIMVTAGPFVPPDFDPGQFTGQSWAERLQRTHTYGFLGSFELAESWQLDLAVFESRSTRYRSFVDLFVDVAPDRSARNIVISEPELPARWSSGEARLTYTLPGEGFDHRLAVSLRGRDKEVEQGGGAAVDLGAAQVGEPNSAPEPDFVFQQPTTNLVTQWSAGLAYVGRWRRLAEWNFGAQTTNYSQSVERAGVVDDGEAELALYNASVVVKPTSWLAFYAGHVTGLEETAAPPSSAANRYDAPPPSQTEQWDAGVRLTIGDTHVVAGVFETQRPYFATDANNFYGQLGDRRTRGAELSIVAQPLDSLRLVAGVVHYDARVEGEAVELGRAGPRPLGSSNLNARLDLDYAISGQDGWSAQLAIVHSGATIASTSTYAELGGRQLEVPPATTLDLGLRYRWSLNGVPMAARLQLLNVTDEHLLRSTGANAFTLNGSRRWAFQLSADF